MASAAPNPKSAAGSAGRLSPRTIAIAFAIGALIGFVAPAAGSDRSGGLLPVPAFDIARGEVVTADKLTEKHFYYDPSRPVAAITDPTSVIGKAARRHLAAGRPMPRNAFKAHDLVKRGRLVIARFRDGNLTIDASVLAQDSGGEGDLVRAKNIDSGRVITGVVRADGTISVNAL